MEERRDGFERPGRIQLNCLGSGGASVDGRAVSFRTRKTLGLLAYLAATPGPHPRESVADLLWPDGNRVEPRVSLRTALTYLRQALGEAAPVALVATRDGVGLAHGAAELDVDALHEARQLSRRTQDIRLRHQIRAAVDRYRGPFLAGLSFPDAPEFEAWLEGQRAHWRGIVAELLSLLATMQEEAGETWDSLASLERWTVVNPDDETAWGRLIELQLQHENLAGARAAWDAYGQALRALDATPSKVMNALHQRIVSSPSAVRDELPGLVDLDLQQTPFVGRPREWAALQAAYRRVRNGKSESVVLSGPGGVGTSRLASEFVSSIRGAGADVIAGRCLQGIGQLPYAPLIAALRTRLEQENAPEDLLSDLWLTELARLVPELLERYPDLRIQPADALTRGRIFEAVSRLGIALGRRKPLAILLDDIEWMDPETRALLQYATRRWTETQTPVLLLLVGKTPIRADLEQWLESLESETRMTRLEIGPLPAADVTRLLGILSGSTGPKSETLNTFARWLSDRTGGRPRPVLQTLRGMLDNGVLHVRPSNERGWAIDLPDEAAVHQFAFAAMGS